MERKLEADYLIIGAGAMGMAFADEVIHGSKDATVVMVERRAKAGGHWNDAYPFVTLHQPALYYGVNSEPLGSGGADLVSKAQILGYYEHVIKKLKRTGRFEFLPSCDYEGEGRVASRLDPELTYDVGVRRRTVDASYMKVQVPATTPPTYAASSDVTLVPINALANIEHPWSRYVIIGAGKTGIDAALYLLERGVDPDRIRWIVSQDSWFLNRKALMPKELSSDLPAQLRCIAESNSLNDILQRLESERRLLRLDPNVWPTKYRCATVTDEELDALRRIKDVIRMGRVVRIEASTIALTKGQVPAEPDTLYVDCTADGLAKRPARPIFDGELITLQSVSMCQQVFSAALIAAVEQRFANDEERNALCQPVPHPEYSPDFLACLKTTVANLERIGPRMPIWPFRKRLSLNHHMTFFGAILFLVRTLRWRVSDPSRLDAMIEAHNAAAHDSCDPHADAEAALRSETGRP